MFQSKNVAYNEQIVHVVYDAYQCVTGSNGQFLLFHDIMKHSQLGKDAMQCNANSNTPCGTA